MKPSMLFSIILLTAIILAASFGLHIAPIDPLYKLSDEIAARALYVCPASSNFFDSFARGIRPITLYINMFFFGAIMFLVFSWGWALYQNLLKDKYTKDSFKSQWWFTKVIFWFGIIITILIWTPNHYRTVHLQGVAGDWVLCEENTPGAKPVLADSVKR